MIRFLSFLVYGEEKARENLSSVSLCLPRWEFREYMRINLLILFLHEICVTVCIKPPGD